ncbi:MAG TPA: molybdopterin-dependent oxidoreductase [Mycobacterium sp.]|nr:molybdopterin-dependent oxidoreductase [Mycobacterium sp.]
MPDTTPTVEHKVTFCRICEPLCGMIATVEDGRLTALRPDKQHPLSAGFACQKGIAFTEVVNDPDRITTPLRRTADGFEPVSWDTAMADIAERVSTILAERGPGAFGWYMGNPGAFSYGHVMSALGFIKGLGRGTHFYTASSQDTNSRLMASQLLYGTPISIPIPDLTRTDLLVVIGANPVVSHGSFLTAPRIKDHMHDIVKRGGRVVVIDPRRTETATQFEWCGIVPDTDSLLLLSLLHVLLTENLADAGRLESVADGMDWLRGQVQRFAPEVTEARTGIDADVVRGLARDLAATPRAAIYGRLGTCVGRYGTLTSYLIDVVNLVAGNLDRPGGSVFGGLGLPGERWVNVAMGALLRRTYRRRRSRIGGIPALIGSEPAALMAKELLTPGQRQIKALFISAGNPVLSVPNGDELASALRSAQLTVALDFYLTETTALCDYVLPVTTMYERDDFPLTFQLFQATPFRQATEAVIAPVGQARTESQIVGELITRLAGRSRVFTVLAALNRAMGGGFSSRRLADGIIRIAGGGDRFGLRRGGLTFDRLTRERPHGTILDPHLETGRLRRVIGYRSGRIQLRHHAITEQIELLSKQQYPAEFPLRMIGMRETRSENSWMHNAPLLMRGERGHHGLMHVDDAAELGIEDGTQVQVRSPYGQITVSVNLTKDIMAGVIALPHGWGHNGTGGWQLANKAGGANVNQLTSSDPGDVEALSGMAWLSGVPVRVSPV